MEYQIIEPPDYLKNYIRYFWKLESNVEYDLPQTFKTIADGCPGIIVHQPQKGVFYQNNKQLPGVCLYGQSTKHAEIYSTGKLSLTGVYFRPNTLKSVFGLEANELTDSCTDLNLISEKQGFYLSEQLSETVSAKRQIEILSAYLFFQIKKNSSLIDKKVDYALSQISQSRGSVSLKILQKDVGLSERSLERKFKQFVGISPKVFSRICRFQASLNQLRECRYNRLSDVAYENDYTDQSHFIRAFQEFAGASPYQFQKQSSEIIENLSCLKK